MSLDDDVVYDMIEEPSTEVIWKKLEDLYMEKNFTNRLVLKQKLYSFKKKDEDDLKGRIDAFNK